MQLLRLNNLEVLDQKRETLLAKEGFHAVAGVDEAGRGPLAGPVVAAACIVPLGFPLQGVNDSKQLTSKQRDYLFTELTLSGEVSKGIGIIDVETIDIVNILQATILAMKEAIRLLDNEPDYLLVDGLALPYPFIPSEKIIKGDATIYCIAAASVLAKVTRDRLMQEYDKRWPEYEFAQHKGYGTPRHLELLKKFGPSPIHRKTFEPVKSMIAALTH